MRLRSGKAQLIAELRAVLDTHAKLLEEVDANGSSSLRDRRLVMLADAERFDLHLHTTRSDGGVTEEALLLLAGPAAARRDRDHRSRPGAVAPRPGTTTSRATPCG